MTTCARCGTEFEQPGKGRPRRFCTPKCTDLYHKEKLAEARTEAATRSPRHIVTNVDIDNSTGDCAVCGPSVRVYQAELRTRAGRTYRRFRCATRVRSQEVRARDEAAARRRDELRRQAAEEGRLRAEARATDRKVAQLERAAKVRAEVERRQRPGFCAWCDEPLPPIDGKGSARRYCSPDCREEFNYRVKGYEPRVQHRLSDIDAEAGQATCSVCGPKSRVWRSGRKRRAGWRCANREGAARASREHGWRRRGMLNMTVHRYDEMMVAQQGGCAICEVKLDRPQVDHDHTTGVVRGLLCSTCNTGLGKFGDDPERLEAAAAYLRAVHE